ncbi:MAG: alanine:cation symporter family protein [Burkholderiales bacterium]
MSAAFLTALSWFPYVLAIAVLLFAFSTMISWSYDGLKAWTSLVGEGKIAELIFKFFFCVCVVIRCGMSLGPVIDFSDSMIFAMAIPNVIGLYMLMSFMRDESNQYWRKIESGKIRKVGASSSKVKYA